MARTGVEPSEMRCGDVGAISSPHQHAVLGVAQVRDAHREPYSDRRQSDGKGEGRHVRQHALTKIVGLIPGLLVTRQIAWLSLCVVTRTLLRISPLRRSRRGARPEFKHAVLFLGRDGLLGIHCFQLRYALIFSTPSYGAQKNLAMPERS